MNKTNYTPLGYTLLDYIAKISNTTDGIKGKLGLLNLTKEIELRKSLRKEIIQLIRNIEQDCLMVKTNLRY